MKITYMQRVSIPASRERKCIERECVYIENISDNDRFILNKYRFVSLENNACLVLPNDFERFKKDYPGVEIKDCEKDKYKGNIYEGGQ